MHFTAVLLSKMLNALQGKTCTNLQACAGTQLGNKPSPTAYRASILLLDHIDGWVLQNLNKYDVSNNIRIRSCQKIEVLMICKVVTDP